MKTIEQSYSYKDALSEQDEIARLIQVRNIATKAVSRCIHFPGSHQADPEGDNDTVELGYNETELTPAA